MTPKVLAKFVTTTTYATWLPGDLRGYVERGEILPPAPELLAYAKNLLLKDPVVLTPVQQWLAFHSLRAAAQEFLYDLTDASVDSWHFHWLVSHGFDPVPDMVGRLKTRVRQNLRIGRVWTEGFCHRCLYSADEIEVARNYIARHAGCRLTAGTLVEHPPRG